MEQQQKKERGRGESQQCEKMRAELSRLKRCIDDATLTSDVTSLDARLVGRLTTN